MDKIDHTFDQSGLMTRRFTSDADGKIVMHTDYQQDISANIEHATRLRNDDDYTRQGIKQGWMHAAHIPDIAILKLRGIGVDILGGKPTAKEILAGLRKLGMDHLITTRARV